MGRIRNAKKIILVLSAAIFIATYGVSLTYPTKTEALLQTGDNAPDFTLKDIEGRETGLSRFSQKKAVIILFWSTWSVNSSVALKRFEEYYKKYKDRGILVVGINADNQTISDEDMKAIKNWLKSLISPFLF